MRALTLLLLLNAQVLGAQSVATGQYNGGNTFTFGTPPTAVKDITSFSTREAGTFTIPEVTINKCCKKLQDITNTL